MSSVAHITELKIARQSRLCRAFSYISITIMSTFGGVAARQDLSINRFLIHPCRIFLNKIKAMLGVFAHQALDEIADAGAVFIFLGEGDPQ